MPVRYLPALVRAECLCTVHCLTLAIPFCRLLGMLSSISSTIHDGATATCSDSSSRTERSATASPVSSATPCAALHTPPRQPGVDPHRLHRQPVCQSGAGLASTDSASSARRPWCACSHQPVQRRYPRCSPPSIGTEVCCSICDQGLPASAPPRVEPRVSPPEKDRVPAANVKYSVST